MLTRGRGYPSLSTTRESENSDTAKQTADSKSAAPSELHLMPDVSEHFVAMFAITLIERLRTRSPSWPLTRRA